MRGKLDDAAIRLSHWSFLIVHRKSLQAPFMNPVSPSSSEDLPLTNKPRPTLANLDNASAEVGLWSLDDDRPNLQAPREASKPAVAFGIPAPRPTLQQDVSRKENTEDGVTRLDVGKQETKERLERPIADLSKIGSEVAGLDSWEEDLFAEPVDRHAEALVEFAALKIAEKPSAQATPTPPREAIQRDVAEKISAPSPASVAAPAKEAPPAGTEQRALLPLILSPLRSMTAIERIGLFLLLVLVTVGGGWFFLSSLYQLPAASERVAFEDFPIKGSHVEIKSASTYWRAPAIGGSTPDVVRRGTAFLPVIKLQMGMGSGMLRAVFRDQDGVLIGDVQVRSVNAEQWIEIPATAGFEDGGMYAAYRAGEGKPWSVRISEAAANTTAVAEFKVIFETNISTERK